jgi:hypothetical protein
LKPAVLKTVRPERVSGVRIPPPPPYQEIPTNTLHRAEYIETKQLHLKDGAQFVPNVVSDLKRHTKGQCLGVVYLVDETRSRFKMKRPSFDRANRKAKYGVSKVMKALQHHFHQVYPVTKKEAHVRRFSGAGRLDLYAFVVEKAR